MHEPPLHLLGYNILVAIAGKHVYLIFILCDLFIALLLSLTARRYMIILKKSEKKEQSEYAKDVNDILLTKHDFSISPTYVAAAYLFNPYLVFNCVGLTTTVFNNLFMTVFLYGLTHGM